MTQALVKHETLETLAAELDGKDRSIAGMIAEAVA